MIMVVDDAILLEIRLDTEISGREGGQALLIQSGCRPLAHGQEMLGISRRSSIGQ